MRSGGSNWCKPPLKTTEEEREENAAASVAARGEDRSVEAAASPNADRGQRVLFFFFLQQRQFNKLCLRRLQSIRRRKFLSSDKDCSKNAVKKKKMSLHPSPPDWRSGVG